MRGAADARALLDRAQAGIRSRFDDFRRAFDRRDRAAYTLALADFHEWLCRWTEAEQRALLPALRRADLPGRDAQRELTLEYVQLRELTRYLRTQVEGGETFALADALGLAENLARRLEAHERQNREVYYPAAAGILDEDEIRQLEEAARGC